MRLFGKKKKQQQQQQQQQQHQSGEFETHTEVNATTARIITPIKEVISRNNDHQYRETTSNRSIGSRTPSFRNKSISPKATTTVVEKSPTSILHKDTHFGTFPTPSATAYDMTDDYNHNHNPRVRFLSSGESSIASASESSAVHMMAGGTGSVASSSAMSSSGVLNKVMEEEYRRLNAMGMLPVDPQRGKVYKVSAEGGEGEEGKRLNAMGMSSYEPRGGR